MAGRFGAILSSLSLAAGQSVRRNAGDSAFEAYTPFNSASDTIAYTQVNNLATARLVGRTTAGTGALEAISIGSGLSLSAGTLSATGGGLSIGSAVSGGGANRVLYEDGSQNLAASANLTFDGSVLNTDVKAFQTNLALINGGDRSAALGYTVRITTDLGSRTPLQLVGVSGQSNPLLAIYDNLGTLNGRWDATGNISVNALTVAGDIGTSSGKGTKIGTATSQKLAFYNSSPIVQVTTGVTGATFTANSGTAVNDASTFDGYTIGQIVKALRNYGLLA